MTRATIVLALLFLCAAAPAQQPAGAPDTATKKSNQPDVLKSEQFSDAVATALLSRLADGFTRRNPKLFLSAFEPQHFPGYALFSDRMRARLGQNYAFRAYYRIVSTQSEDTRTTVNVELQVEEDPVTPGPPPVRNTGQARFTFERGAAGWKIVDVAPRALLTGVRGPA